MFSFLKKEPKCYAVEDEIRITLLGKTGAGKSETGNTLLGREYFVAKDYGTSVTRKCCLGEVIRGKKKIVVVDTPGLYDTKLSKEETKKELAKCIGLTTPGPHCFLVVIQVGRFTFEDHQTVKDLMHLFGNEAQRYIIVIFTKIDSLRGDQSLSYDKKFQNYIKRIPEDLHNFLVFCGKRFIGFNNNQPFKKRNQQVDQLLKFIQDTMIRNGGRFYSNEMYEESERMIQAQVLRVDKMLQQMAKEKEDNLRLEIEKENQTRRKQALENEVKRLRQELEKDRNDEELRRKIRSEIEKETGSFLDTLWPYLKMGLTVVVEKLIKDKLGIDVATMLK
ncbi:GTPase IMAP family member 4-like [Mytilus californianus]|uniref:GTPase IMAP family member 4-like n=1 Tax=Mytilus californianus TaxID=6549 RepID=UPI0022481467|nr:GTPase IMAP family member 4-like [Mytilus californianus]